MISDITDNIFNHGKRLTWHINRLDKTLILSISNLSALISSKNKFLKITEIYVANSSTVLMEWENQM